MSDKETTERIILPPEFAEQQIAHIIPCELFDGAYLSFGEWIDHGRDRPPTCSVCGSGCLLNYEGDYCKSEHCPHCGAALSNNDYENNRKNK